MTINRPVSMLIVGFVLLSLATIISAGKPDGKGKGGGGQAEETASMAQLYDDADLYALRGDGEVVVVEVDEEGGNHNTSLYQDSTLLDSTDCALVIATSIDKQSGTAFLWVPSPRRDDANCVSGPNRWFESEDNPEFEDQYGDVYAKIQLAGLYRPEDEVIRDGVIVSVAIGPYRIEYQPTKIVVIDDSDGRDGFGDIRTVTAGTVPAFPASICEWPTGKQKGKTICEPIVGGIQLPMKVKFTRIPPQ